MKFSDFLQKAASFSVSVSKTKEDWTLITVTSGDLVERYTVHGNVVVLAEVKTAPPK